MPLFAAKTKWHKLKTITVKQLQNTWVGMKMNHFKPVYHD